jgi:hypothetical protein
MKEVYELVASNVDTQRRVADYFFAAVGADNNFDKFREGVKRVKRLEQSIRKTADDLASLIEQAESDEWVSGQLIEVLRSLRGISDADLVCYPLPENLRSSISSRKTNPTWGYIRYLWSLLYTMGFSRSTGLSQTIAITANVVTQNENETDWHNVHKVLISPD